MKHNFYDLLCVARDSLLLAAVFGGLTACKDDYELDDDGVSPGYLSIYSLLQNPEQISYQEHHLDGTFKTYLRLADDLNYADVFARTGSKTIFPANDEAFERFFQNNSWGVHSYEDLNETQKRQLLYGSMIDNALLTNMLSNIQQGDYGVNRGQAMRHNSAISITDTITHIAENAQLPQNNAYWDKFRQKGIYYVADATKPSMVHFTREHMLTNNITVSGENSDFEVITGAPFDEKVSTYMFRNPVINRDVRALNGYVHQVRDVLVPQPNIAEVIRTSGESNYFSRMLDRFSVPLYAPVVTRNYNDYAELNHLPLIDSIFQKNYFNSADGLLIDDANNLNIQMNEVLDFDPGRNSYAPANANEQSDMCAIFVPTDKAMEEYFLPGGGGAFILEEYGKRDNTRENLMQNIDSIPLNLVRKLLANLMKASFVESVPSKFSTVLNDAAEPMGLSLDMINRNENGEYDVKIANNGVAYMLNTVIAPDDYQCVYAPATIKQDMLIMRKAIEDGSAGNNQLGLDLNFFAYLKAMRANYALFIPKDLAFQSGQYYVDPTYLRHLQPRALKFYIDEKGNVACSSWKLDPNTFEISDSIGVVSSSQFKTQLIDILNYSTIVLPSGVTLESSGNRYFKTKHGGEVFFDRSSNQTTVATASQIDQGLDVSGVIQTYPEKNGTAYIIDRVLQAPLKQVYDVLTDSINHPQFSDFYDLTSDARIDRLLIWAAPEQFSGKTESGKYKTDPMHMFLDNNGLTTNVNYFSTYNYTVYLPNNDAMAKARNLGLPTWDDVSALEQKWSTLSDEEYETYADEIQADKDKALAMIEQINSFIRYHVQNNSIYVDNQVMSDNLTPVSTSVGDEFATAYANLLGIRQKLTLKGGQNQFTVIDATGAGTVISGNNGLMTNKMTRDYVFNAPAASASSISASSFAVIHEINRPLIHNASGRYDADWTQSNSRSRLARVRKLFTENFNKRY